MGLMGVLFFESSRQSRAQFNHCHSVQLPLRNQDAIVCMIAATFNVIRRTDMDSVPPGGVAADQGMP